LGGQVRQVLAEWQQGMALLLEASSQKLSFSYAQNQLRIRARQVIKGMKTSHGFSLVLHWQVDSGRMLGYGVQVTA
jgi:hypothetical protein